MRMICGPGELKVWEATHRTVSIILREQFTLFREAWEAERTEALAGAVLVSVTPGHKLNGTYNVSHGCME